MHSARMECVNKAGQLMSLAALQQHDPYIVNLLDVAGQVALYTFNSKANEWEKTEIEGTLFVYARSASPHHGFTIMNRLSTENLVEPINKDLEFQLQDPFLLYRNGNLGIYSIWFYDKADCQRIAQLMLQIVKQEALRGSPDRGPSSRTNGCVQSRPTDILELLSKAKEEYQRSQSSDTDVQGSSEAALSLEKREEVTAAQHEKSGPSVKQITVEELFGSSLSREVSQSSSSSVGEGKRGPVFAPLCPSVEPLLAPRLSADPGAPALVSLFQSCGTRDPRPAASNTEERSSGPSVQRGSAAYRSPLTDGFMPGPLVTPQSFRESTCKLPGPFTGKTALSAPVNTPSSVFMSKEAHAFTPSSTRVKPLPAGPAVQGEESSLLLSPNVFQHSVIKTAEPLKIPASPTSPSADLYSRTQLRDTLIHLIKNDGRFLSAIHEAYTQSLSKGLNNIKL
ncbi:mRNA-decapping enzyme 1A [Carassius gibelio]|uniref:mRNA-decapping enzyme 1A n=1 Tax=Carassius gibelio TaxID=101364 RepID=UPI0022788C5B|nr:mRNA-decapping enzyme 1A [Carassius gibelio]